MDIDKDIQEILQRSLPVNDNCVHDETTDTSSSRTMAKKSDYLLESINIVGNQNVIIATNSLTILLLIIFIFVSIFR